MEEWDGEETNKIRGKDGAKSHQKMGNEFCENW